MKELVHFSSSNVLIGVKLLKLKLSKLFEWKCESSFKYFWASCIEESKTSNSSSASASSNSFYSSDILNCCGSSNLIVKMN